MTRVTRCLVQVVVGSAFLCVSVGAAAEVRVVRDIDYLGGGRAEKLDLYLPPASDEAKRYPAVIIIHGGGWVGGDKGAKREQNIGTNLAQAGYVCASINYVLAKQKEDNFAVHLATVWPQHLYDCKTAVRFLRKHAGVYKIDAERIGVIGGSAGGHLAAMVGLTGADDKLDPAGRYSEYSCRVQAVVPMYGAHDLIARSREKGLFDEMTPEQRELCRVASPVSYASSDDPPTLILHGPADATVPVSQSELLAAALRKAKANVELVVVEGAPHSFHLEPSQRDLRPLVISFFDKHLKRP